MSTRKLSMFFTVQISQNAKLCSFIRKCFDILLSTQVLIQRVRDSTNLVAEGGWSFHVVLETEVTFNLYDSLNFSLTEKERLEN
jgi:hypothetical protein